MVDIPVNGAVLAWARKERHLSVGEAATLLKIEEEQLAFFESGDESPNVGILRSMAAKYKITFASLLMPEPLDAVTRPVVSDHRTFEGARPEYSLQLQQTLDEIWEYIEHLCDLKPHEPDLFVSTGNIPTVQLTQDAREAAYAERARIGFPIDVQIGCATDREVFLRWRSVIERQGVFVYIKNLGNDDNCRGFAINDARQIPFIFLNSDESEMFYDYRSRAFGLVHEYCHIMMRQNILSDHRRGDDIERYCNRFAAYFLMPEERFRKECLQVNATKETVTEQHVRRLAAKFHTSLSAVAIHLETLDLAPSGFYHNLLTKWKAEDRRSGTGRASHEEKLANRLGANYIALILEAAQRGTLNSADVHEMTGIKPQYYSAIKSEIDARNAAYGGT